MEPRKRGFASSRLAIRVHHVPDGPDEVTHPGFVENTGINTDSLQPTGLGPSGRAWTRRPGPSDLRLLQPIAHLPIDLDPDQDEGIPSLGVYQFDRRVTAPWPGPFVPSIREGPIAPVLFDDQSDVRLEAGAPFLNGATPARGISNIDPTLAWFGRDRHPTEGLRITASTDSQTRHDDIGFLRMRLLTDLAIEAGFTESTGK